MNDTLYIPVNKRMGVSAGDTTQYVTTPTATGQNTTSYSIESDTVQVCSYGQSLSISAQGVPVLTTEPMFSSNLMLGDCVRRSNMRGTNFIPTGDGLLKPMVASAQSNHNEGEVISNSEANNLPLGSTAVGEDLVVSAANTFKHMLNIRRGLKDVDSVNLIATSAGDSGKSIEALSKGAVPNLYGSLTDSVVKARAQSGENHPVAALLWTQGESNYGVGATKGDYKQKLKKLYKDFTDDMCTEQDLKPALIMYQTGGTYTRDSTDLAIGMAQLELGLSEDNMYLATPSYQYPNHPGGHLASNGYRWMGCQYGKVMDIVINKREQWKPTHMVKAKANGNSLYVTIYAPVPPLQIKPCFNGFDLTQYDNCGFTVKNAGQTNNVTRCEVVGPTTLKLTCESPVKAGDELWYAEKTLNNGIGNICDSDTTVAVHNYEYMELPSMSPKENLPEFVDKPYPLENWLCAAIIEIE